MRASQLTGQLSSKQRPFANKKSQELQQEWSATFPGGELELPGSSPSSATALPLIQLATSALSAPPVESLPLEDAGRRRSGLSDLSEPPWLGPSRDCNFLPAESEPHLTLVSQDLSSKELHILASLWAVHGAQGWKNL